MRLLSSLKPRCVAVLSICKMRAPRRTTANPVIEIQSLRFGNVLGLIVTASTDHDVSGILARQGQIAGNEVVRIGQHIGVQENRKSPSCQFYEAIANYCAPLIVLKHSERGWNVALLKLLSELLSR